jgi:uncharacterized phage-associated protein
MMVLVCSKEIASVAAPYSPLALANEFIARFKPGEGIEHMKLQKLVYCANGWWLVFNPDRPLVNEAPEVWKFGPVFPSLYHVMKVYGRAPVKTMQSISPFARPDRVSENDADAFNVIDWTWRRYGHMSSFGLSEMTHREGTAWRRAAADYNFIVPEGFDIPLAYIVDEFKKVYDSESKRSA